MGEVIDGKMKLNEIGMIIFEEWLSTEQKRGNVKLHEFVVMPDHFHGLIEIKHSVKNVDKHEMFYSPKNTIGSIVRGFKSSTTVQLYEYISSHELHWRRGELIFAPNTTGKEFAPNESRKESALHDSEVKCVPNNSEHGSTSDESVRKLVRDESAIGRGELIFAPNEPGKEFAPNDSDKRFTSDESEKKYVKEESAFCRGELIFAPNTTGKEFAPNDPEMKSGPQDSEIKSAPNDSVMISTPNDSEKKFALKDSESTCAPFKLWQRGYYDRFIRTQDELIAIKNYIKANPSRWASKMNEISL
jgi:REP element-mobilizing transposase RayT